ncbi:DUF1971 domain-containing protein [Aurantiacibacter gilvus]|uniref:DUF1971 domain-containing protein n=1 Tax=Aurantiacibacter gilvus TaxID=3139141 RepID=A0ABU9IHZ0_9SPHN
MNAISAGQRFAAPEAARAYRSIGPFDADSLPAGLLREHRLKQGTWARLTVLWGRIGFAWDDGESDGEVIVLQANDTIDVPPVIPHHLESQGEEFRLAIEFLAE